jgi:hypothetical protein
MLQGKVNAQNQLLVSSVVSAADALSASIDSTTKFTDAVLIPTPPPGFRVVLTGVIASALVAGPFSLRLNQTDASRTLGPVWLPSSGAAALVTGRVFTSGPIVRPLPEGQGLTLTTSVDAPQSVFVTYRLDAV